MPHLFFIILKFKKMKFLLFVFLAIIDFGFIVVKGDESDLCKIWSDIERQLQNEDFLISCTTNYNCYGVNCSGATRGYNITSTIHLHACENPPSVEFEVDVPKLDINGIKRRITHNDSIPLTKNLNIEFGIERRNQMLRLGVFVHFINNGSFPLLRVPMRIPVISNLNFPINCSLPEETTGISSSVNHIISTVSSPPKSFLIVSKSNADGYSNCSIVNSTCNEEEMCQQLDKMKPDGICICITNYTRNEHGKCVLHNQAVDNYSSVVLAAILVPIFVGLILVAVVYIMIRFRIFQNLRRRLRVQVYEHVLLGEDEEEEDMTNPVA